jgi:predicted ABC-type ATPase
VSATTELTAMPDIIIVAGPNGAGKTSFANEFFPHDRADWVYLNADEIARDLQSTGYRHRHLDLAAGRLMLQRLDDAITAHLGVVFETTLATLVYQRRILEWKSAGYHVILIYLRLPTADAAVRRVAGRVAAGGHAIPVSTITQRFLRSLDYLERCYKPIVDEWYVWDSVEGDFLFVEAWDR